MASEPTATYLRRMTKWLYELTTPNGRLYAAIYETPYLGDVEQVLCSPLWIEAGLNPADDDPSVSVVIRELANA